MVSFPEYESYDATGLAELIHSGQISPTEVLEVAISRIEAMNPQLNAVVESVYERARSRSTSLPAGPLHGVPFLLKDLKLQLEGTVTTNSTKLFRGRVAATSSELAKRYEAAGLQILGKTNTPEFGIMGITEPKLRGPCRNPWSLDHTPGGSSGGAASAVAARMVAAAHAGDGGGSIRIPASHCGLFGLKPTRGRVTQAPFYGESWGGFVQEHVVCRSVRDSALFLDIVDAPTAGEPYAAPYKRRSWAVEASQAPKTLNIAFCRDALYAGETHPDCLAAVDDAVQLLTELGHTVIEGCPSFPKEEMVRAYLLTVACGTARFVDVTSAAAGKRPTFADYEPATWLMALIGWKTGAAELLEAQVTMQRASRDVAAFFEDIDVFITPTTAQPPARIGELAVSPAEYRQVAVLRHMPFKPILDYALDKMASGKLAYTPNTQLFNQTGQPAMSVPLFWNAEGLPIGTQFVGRFGDEATLFQLASQLEEARPWVDKIPAR